MDWQESDGEVSTQEIHYLLQMYLWTLYWLHKLTWFVNCCIFDLQQSANKKPL